MYLVVRMKSRWYLLRWWARIKLQWPILVTFPNKAEEKAEGATRKVRLTRLRGFECVTRRIGCPGVFTTNNPKQWVESEGQMLFEACRAFRR